VAATKGGVGSWPCSRRKKSDELPHREREGGSKRIGIIIAAHHWPLCTVGFDMPVFGTFGLRHRFEIMRKTSKSRKAVIPEPSFKFFIRAMSAMLLLVVIMAAYFSLHTQQM